MASLIKKYLYAIYCSANLREDVFILHNQWVGVYVSGEEVLSVAFSAPLCSALHILSPWGVGKGGGEGESIKSKLKPFSIKNDFVCIVDSWVYNKRELRVGSLKFK